MKLILSGLSGVWNIISLILIFVFIVVLAYFAAKLAARYQSNVLNYKSNIKIIESFRLGNNKFIAIVKIGEDYYALGVGKDEITCIDKIDADKLVHLETANSSEKMSFKEILSKMKNGESKDLENDSNKNDSNENDIK